MVLLSCGTRDPCLKSTGPYTREVRWVPPYHGVYLQNGMEYLLTPDSTPAVTLQGGVHLLPFVEMVVEQGILRIRDRNTCSFLRSNGRKMLVSIPAGHIRYINYQGYDRLNTLTTLRPPFIEVYVREGGDVALGLECRQFIDFEHTGFGDVFLTGSSSKLTVQYREFCTIDAATLLCDSLSVKAESVAKGSFYAEKHAKVRLLSKGDVHLYGKATLELERSGSGQVRIMQ